MDNFFDLHLIGNRVSMILSYVAYLHCILSPLSVWSILGEFRSWKNTHRNYRIALHLPQGLGRNFLHTSFDSVHFYVEMGGFWTGCQLGGNNKDVLGGGVR